MRRAFDLIMPPESSKGINYLRVKDIGVKSLVNEIERGKLTGVVKISSKKFHSRGCLLLLSGRVFGVIYGDKSDELPKPTAVAVYDVVSQLKDAQTAVMMYPLTEQIVIPLASLFVGYPVERHDDYTAADYLDYILNWLLEKAGTATLAISESGRYPATTLAYIYNGYYCGCFNVDDVTFNTDINSLRTRLKGAPKAVLEVSILPAEFHEPASTLGLTLSAMF